MSEMKLPRKVSHARTSYSAVVTAGRMKSELQQAVAVVGNPKNYHALIHGDQMQLQLPFASLVPKHGQVIENASRRVQIDKDVVCIVLPLNGLKQPQPARQLAAGVHGV